MRRRGFLDIGAGVKVVIILISRIQKRKDSRPSRAAAELIPLALFALSHRYLGTPSVINALACGLVLRLCTLKAGSLLPAVAAHTAYNGALLILSFGM